MEPLIENFDKLIRGTKSGQITWTRLNNLTYVWQTKNAAVKRLNVILQRIKVASGNDGILFRLFNVEAKSVILDIRTERTTSDVKAKMFELYQIIESSFESGKIDILSDLLKDI